MTDLGFLFLLVIHVGAAASFFGSVLVSVFVLSPTFSKFNPSARKNILQNLLPKLTTYIAATGVATAVAGVFLYGYVGSVALNYFPIGWRFIFFLLGAILGLAATLTSFAIASYTSRIATNHSVTKSGEMTEVNDAGIQNVPDSVRTGLAVVAVLLSFTIVFMILGVNA